LPVSFIKSKTCKCLLFWIVLLFACASSLLLFSCSSQESGPDPETGNQELATEEEEEEEEETGAETEPQNQTGNSGSGLDDRESNCKFMELYSDPELPRVGLYAGKGSWNENVEVTGYFLDHYGFEWSSFDEKEAVHLNFEENYDLLWFPGGFAAEYKNYIDDHSNIRDFVSSGGLFIGSCAGAYYASDILRWQGTDYEYPLDLFDGKGVGPLSGQIGSGETGTIELTEEHPVNRDFKAEKEMYYFDGPYFEPYDRDSVSVLARYQANSEPAIIAGEKESGKYLLLGPHPEIGGYSGESPSFSPDGEEGTQWPWLYEAVLWLSQNESW